MRVDSRTVCRPTDRRPCVVVLVRRPPWSRVIRHGRASSVMVVRRALSTIVVCPWSPVVHRPLLRCGCPLSVVVRRLSLLVIHPSSIVVGHPSSRHRSPVVQRTSSVTCQQRGSVVWYSLAIRHRVIGRLSSNATDIIMHHLPLSVVHRRSCIVSHHWSVDRRLALSTVNKITMNDRMRVKCRGILMRDSGCINNEAASFGIRWLSRRTK